MPPLLLLRLLCASLLASGAAGAAPPGVEPLPFENVTRLTLMSVNLYHSDEGGFSFGAWQIRAILALDLTRSLQTIHQLLMDLLLLSPTSRPSLRAPELKTQPWRSSSRWRWISRLGG